MISKKVTDFDDEIIRVSDISKALSHPVRIKILQILAQKNVCICGDLVELLPLAQSTVSQHLKELKRVGLIQGEVEGPKTCYCLDMEMVKKSRGFLIGLFSKICDCE
jgi:DNA-binding transcriptional ArsR family regulator